MDGIDIDRVEALHIAISVIAISFGFAMVFSGPGGVIAYPKEFAFFMAAVFVTVGSGFVLHEMAHKLTSLSYGVPARFVMSVQGLAFTLLSAFMGFLIGLPGATMILSPDITMTEYAVISIAGPILNILLVVVFLALNHFAPISQYFSFLYPSPPGFEGFGITNGTLMVWKFGAALNLWLALFNMIPAFPLDGSKVWRWKPWVWILSTVAMMAIGSAVIGPSIIVTWLIMTPILIIISKLLYGWAR